MPEPYLAASPFRKSVKVFFGPCEPCQIFANCLLASEDLGTIAKVSGAATVSESYQLIDVIEDGPDAEHEETRYLRLVNTGTIDRYEILWGLKDTRYLKHTYRRPTISESALAEILPTRYEQAKSPKIILAGIVTRLEACYDPVGSMLAGESTVIVMDAALELTFLLALINSKLCSFLYQELFGALALQGGYLQVGSPQVGKLPIRRIEFTMPEEERRALVEAGQALYWEYLDTRDGERLLEFVDSRLQVITDEGGNVLEPEQADVVHDLLAYLAEQMIEMNKEKQAEAKGFLGWLADYTGLPLDDWKLKSYVRAYWKHPWSELQRALSQNKRRMGRNVEGREAREKIKREFEDSMAKLKPLLARIKATDRLIDRIVYRVYELTEEEIAVVGDLDHE